MVEYFLVEDVLLSKLIAEIICPYSIVPSSDIASSNFSSFEPIVNVTLPTAINPE